METTQGRTRSVGEQKMLFRRSEADAHGRPHRVYTVEKLVGGARCECGGLQRNKWICKLFEGSTSASFPVSASELPMQALASSAVTSIGT
jgi:hypothetical protein